MAYQTGIPDRPGQLEFAHGRHPAGKASIVANDFSHLFSNPFGFGLCALLPSIFTSSVRVVNLRRVSWRTSSKGVVDCNGLFPIHLRVDYDSSRLNPICVAGINHVEAC